MGALQGLITPHSSVTAPDEIRTVRLFLQISLSLTVIGALYLLASPFIAANISVLVLAEILLIVAAYALGKSRHYRLGATLVTGILLLALALNAVTAINKTALLFMLVPLLLSSILLDRRNTLITAGVVIAGVLIIPLFYPVLALNAGEFILVISTCVLIILFLYHRDAVERDRRDALTAAFARERAANETAQKERDERVRAEESNQIKSAFLASMSHELRTPLNAVINYTKFVSNGTLGDVNTEQKELLDASAESAEHLLNLINDVLDMSKIESGSLRLFVEDNVNIQKILDTVMATGKTVAAQKPLTFDLQVTGDLPKLRGDRQRILQILLNIMSNAVKFTPQGTITVTAQQDGDDLRIAIRDTGPGIAPEHHQDVFIPFKQTNTGLRQAGGTGLGMPISRSLAQAHGGKVLLDSAEGHGSTFTVVLPVMNPALESTPLA
jgi:signal transduction histidine kinase